MEPNPPTNPTVPDSPDEASTWSQDVRDLLAFAGPDWAIVRAPGDPLALICERNIGTETRIVAGTPRTCLARIREIPADPSRPADLIVADPWSTL